MSTDTSEEITPDDLDRIEELIRYVAAHDGRLPTDDMELSWWVVNVLDQEKDHPVRQAIAHIPVTQLGRDLTPKKGHTWSVWIQRYDLLIWAGRQGRTLDDVLKRDKTMRDWVNDMLSRYRFGTLGVIESRLLERVPLWDPERPPDTRKASREMAFRTGIEAVREFYLKNGHTEIPEGYTVGELDIHLWWQSHRGAYASGTLKDHLRQRLVRLGNLGVDLRTDKQRAADDPAFRHRDRLAEIAEYLAEGDMEVLWGKGAGTSAARAVDTWIAQYHKGRLDPALQEALEAIDGWSWPDERVRPESRPKAPPRKVPSREPKRSVRTDLPDPDSKLNRSGLKQFLPAD